MAIKVNGTTVINDSRQLQNVASLDATTVAAIGAAGVGGGDVSEVAVTYNTHSAFTKPADGLNNLQFPDGYTSTAPPSNKRIMQTTALTGAVYGSVQLFVPTPSVYAQRSGGYWGSGIYFVHYDNSKGRWFYIGSTGSWPSPISFPYQTDPTVVKGYGAGDYFEAYATDLYDGGGGAGTSVYNDNLSFNANTVNIVFSKLAV